MCVLFKITFPQQNASLVYNNYNTKYVYTENTIYFPPKAVSIGARSLQVFAMGPSQGSLLSLQSQLFQCPGGVYVNSTEAGLTLLCYSLAAMGVYLRFVRVLSVPLTAVS